MPKLQYEQCMGCGSFVPMILDTTGLYVSRCWWCGVAMTQVHGIRQRRPRLPLGHAHDRTPADPDQEAVGR